MNCTSLLAVSSFCWARAGWASKVVPRASAETMLANFMKTLRGMGSAREVGSDESVGFAVQAGSVVVSALAGQHALQQAVAVNDLVLERCDTCATTRPAMA